MIKHVASPWRTIRSVLCQRLQKTTQSRGHSIFNVGTSVPTCHLPVEQFPRVLVQHTHRGATAPSLGVLAIVITPTHPWSTRILRQTPLRVCRN